MAEFRLTSPAFEHDDDLPLRFTQDGDDVSPPLRWTGVPEGTKELVLICEDPDADEGVFTHWIVYAVLPDVEELPEGLPKKALLEEPEACQGLNEFDESGYTGPTAADDRGPHRYFFRLYALDVELDIPPGATRQELRDASKGHVLGQAELVGIA